MHRRKPRPLIDALEPRRLFAATPLGINFNDESLWDSNFSTAATQAKRLGVSAVRVWLACDSFDDRPNAWDETPAFGSNGQKQVGNAARAMRRIFELSRQGFGVLVILNPNNGVTPTSDAQVQGYVRHLMDATETPDATQTLADVVDQWEIGNEPDSGSYWTPSAANKTLGLKSYVDDFLIPAATELHSGSPDDWETVVSAGVSYSPADLKVILDELTAKNALGAIDYAGFHPYGAVTSTTNEVRDRTNLAVQYANAVGKKLIATEWNLRGFGNAGANDAAWAKAMDETFRTVIAPNYQAAYYFALVNNWSARGGATSARPGGLLKHDPTLAVTTASTIADTQAYYESPLVSADAFYNVYQSWSTGQVSGKLIAAAGLPSTALPTSTVYLDVNGNSVLDDAEPSTQTAVNGTYVLVYSTTDVPAGDYPLRVVTGGDYESTDTGVTVSIANLVKTTNVDLTVRPTADALAAIGVVGGALWDEANNAGLAGTVWLDLNNNGTPDANEPTATAAADGAYSIAFDTRVVGTGTAVLRAVLPAGFVAGASPGIALLAGQTQVNLRVGVRRGLGSIGGRLWNDNDGNGVFDAADSYTGVRVVYLDTNGNGKLDVGERQTSSDADGYFRFDGLAAGTYNVTRVFPSGYRLSNGTGNKFVVPLTAGQVVANADLGSTNKPAVVTPTVPTVPTPPTTPTPPAGSASIAGKLFAQASKWNAAVAAASWTVFLDTNKNGVRDNGEIFAATKSDLTFAFTGLAAGTYTVALQAASGWKVATPTTKIFTITLKSGQAKAGQNFVVAKS